ncbi:MAG: VWA domain-containing protein [Lentimicrobiaceae bacterium]|jgi:Ca-activated chloride channel family protein|nr:VWA domain-containing protein [Lentimicrobiaceae bacterium]MCP4910032.1 VWA domain-containing protein [Bacteroidota bacterium]MBT3454183.1 VWA domain-containing protein [Lentimicrobiaceae bacterium]MBT3819208.1 VWA domain-containing protein [Lentimicrobiaceae bacterium]MBT4060343.1 VWA domain-containing protein [Lentimicrobiaceae bacterium]
MKLKSKYFLLGIVLTITMGCLGQGNTVSEQPQVTTRILFVLDASRSMSGKWQGESKYTIARNILSDILDSIKQVPNVEVALRVYGHTKNFPPQDCNDTRLEVPFSKDNVDQIKYRLKQLGPKGTSPIANSLLKTKDDFTDCENCRNIVVLITDGIEECGGDICEVSAALQKNGIILKPFIIGIGKDTHEAYDCAGQYFNASNKKQFTKALNIIITKVLSQTSLQINLLDKYNRPTESNVNMTFINKHTGEIAYNYVHTLNSKGRPDTLYVDHLVDYKIIINTVPKTVIDSVKLTEGKHTTVSAECRQGSLMVKLMGSSKSDFNPSIIINNEVYNGILNVQYLNENVKYLTGKYDITILTLPKIVLPEIDIESDNQTKIEIENPGIAVIQKSIKGYGSIYALDKDKQTWIIDFGSNSNTTESLYLQPGSYRLIFRSKFSTQSVTTSVNEFEIFSEKTTRIKL